MFKKFKEKKHQEDEKKRQEQEKKQAEAKEDYKKYAERREQYVANIRQCILALYNASSPFEVKNTILDILKSCKAELAEEDEVKVNQLALSLSQYCVNTCSNCGTDSLYVAGGHFDYGRGYCNPKIICKRCGKIHMEYLAVCNFRYLDTYTY